MWWDLSFGDSYSHQTSKAALSTEIGYFIFVAAKTKQKGVAVFCYTKLLETDPNGQWVCLEIDFNNQKTLLRGIYAPNNTTKCEKFFNTLIKTLLKYDY